MTPHQPTPLPETLPAGTLFKALDHEGACEYAFTETAVLQGGNYHGKYAFCGVPHGRGLALAKHVDWSSYKPAEAPKLCPLSSDGNHTLDRCEERCVYCHRSAASVLEQTPVSSEARPIQAGDWVECLPENQGFFLEVGARYRVAGVGQAGRLLLEDKRHTFDDCRFKRVDGPHAATEPQCAACEQPAGYCAENCPTRPRESTKPTCSECHAPAVLKECYGGMLCGYCADSLEDGHGDRAHIDMVTAQQMLKCEMSDGTPIPGEAKARKRLAGLEQRERPRRTADSRELAKLHPWEEFE